MELIPDELRRAHEDSDVVFFCGAGVSVPAGLPSFNRLVEDTLMRFVPNETQEPVPGRAYKTNQLDQALGILEDHVRGGIRGVRDGRVFSRPTRNS